MILEQAFLAEIQIIFF